MRKMLVDNKYDKPFCFLIAVYGLISISSVTAHPQIGPGRTDDDGGGGSLTVSTNIGNLLYTAPEDFDYDDFLRVRTISSAELIADGDYGIVFNGDIDPILSTDRDDVEELQDLMEAPNYGTDGNFSPTIYTNNKETFDPPFVAKRAIYFKLPPPQDRSKQVLLWLDYNTRTENVKKIVRLDLEHQRDGNRFVERRPEGDIEIVNRAAILHTPTSGIRCLVDFGRSYGSVTFTPENPYIWPIRPVERIACHVSSLAI